MELEPSRYGSTVTFRGRVFNVVSESKKAQKTMQPANYLATKDASFDFPTESATLPLSGTMVQGFDKAIALRETLTENGVDYEVYQVQDDPKEPFVRCVCNRKQNRSTAI